MTREKRPDDIAREAAPRPTEAIGTMRMGSGTVKWWRDAKGYGAIACAEISPWDIWCHFSAIEETGFRTLTPDESVEVEYYRADQESFKYVARKVRRLSESTSIETTG
jgi:CspA family cold shock protein